MTDFQVGDIVQAHITGTLAVTKYVITNIDLEGKNGQPVADLLPTEGDTELRWQYLDRMELVERPEPLTEDKPAEEEITFLVGTTPRFRAFREHLGLSRREVQEGANVSGSALWRIEQDGAKGTPEQRTAVWDFLISFKAANPEGKLKKWSRTHGKPLTENEQMKALQSLYDAAQQNILSYNNLLVAVRTELDEQITKAIANKTSTKGLKAIKAILEGTTGE